MESRTDEYDPFARGRFPVGVRTILARDTERNRAFPCEIWYPAAVRHAGQDLAPENATVKPGTYPLIVFSHPSGGGRRAATFLCTHLSSHTSPPLAGMHEIFDRTPSTKKQMLTLRRSDHAHFMDDVEELHEGFRTMPASGDLAAIQKEMKPITELCSGKQAHLLVRGLTLCYMDAMLRRREEAQRFLRRNIETELAGRGVDVIAQGTWT